MTKDEALKLALEALKTIDEAMPFPVAKLAQAAIKEALAQPAPDYAWPTIADYEKEVGFAVNDMFKAAWSMARTTNDLFTQMENA
jgi:hypothetical protein